ncbi:MAG: iron hydrogenase [Acidaminococcales bacterium]|nr:iron hydrogenase [Acidaminococcales bacterium]
MKFDVFYENIIKESASDKNYHNDFNINQLNCLFRPEKLPVTWELTERLLAFSKSAGNFRPSPDTLLVLEALSKKNHFMQIIIAPAFTGQFSREVSPGMLRNAFKAIGFDGMVEAAVFADILTLKEALEFDANIKAEGDFQLASCCCPMWISMLKKLYGTLMPHVPATVSPMIAAGRTIKILHPGSVTVFVGPCLAKKAEAREADLAGAIDFVLTFKETMELFAILGIDIKQMEDTEKEFSSAAGRNYAWSGGVCEAVRNTVERLNPNRSIPMKTQKASGVPECRKMLDEIAKGELKANFYEGMGCAGGCVGGPRSIIDKTAAKESVSEYGAKAKYKTPIDNPYVIELLHRLGFDTTDSLMRDNEFFTRHF